MAYWYFRLNGFFQIENFIVHDDRDGSQRTDADLLAVRFPHRAERLIDNPNDVMADDARSLSLSDTLIDVVIVEVKTNQPCTLNGPWTRRDRMNVERVLAAIGCLTQEQIDPVAKALYQAGMHSVDDRLRVRLVAVGRTCSDEIENDYPDVMQLVWADMLSFIWNRLHLYRRQKRQVDQWDDQGQKIKRLADRSRSSEVFVDAALALMGVRHGVGGA